MRNLPAPRVSGAVLFALLTTLLLLAVSLTAAPQDGVSEKPTKPGSFTAQSPNPERLPAPPDDILYPGVWVKSGQERLVDSYILNPETVDITVTIAFTYREGPAPWMAVDPQTVVVPAEGTANFTLTLNPGGAINPPAGTAVALEGDILFEVTDPPGYPTGSILVKTIVADTVVPVTIDTITTGMDVSLTVTSNGNAGNCGISRVSMDFVNSGLDCDTTEDRYMFDLTPIVMIDSTNISCQSYYQCHEPNPDFSFKPVPGSPAQSISDPDYNAHKTEIFVTADSSVGLIKTWYAPTDNVSYIIERIDVFSYDGEAYPGVRIGEWIDWDVPTDFHPQNFGGYSLNYGSVDYMWMQGDDHGFDCHDDRRRFAATGIMRWYHASERDSPEPTSHVGLLGGYVLNSELVIDWFGTSPYYGIFKPDSTWMMLNQSSFWISDNYLPFDGRMLLAFGSFDISDDTVSIWLVHASIYDGDEGTLLQTMQGANTWFVDHFDPPPLPCCGIYRNGMPGNADCDSSGKLTLADITKLIDRVYLSKSHLCCEANGDVNCDGKINLADISCLIGLTYHLGTCEVCPCRGR